MLTDHLTNISKLEAIPENHVEYLKDLKKSGFEPRVIYDIGACVLHWTKVARRLWPEAYIIAFDAFEPAEFLWKNARMKGNFDYHTGVLSDSDDKEVRFYQNDFCPGGNSYYREIGGSGIFPEDTFLVKKTRTLDSIVVEKGFPLPDLVKMDVQGSEIDILRGGLHTVAHAKHLIVELQHTQYNEGAPLAEESIPLIESWGWRCAAPLFQNNGADGDYDFVPVLVPSPQ